MWNTEQTVSLAESFYRHLAM